MATQSIAKEQREQRSCLAKAVASGIDGGLFGGAIGLIMTSRTALSFGLSVHSLRILVAGTVSSAVSFGGFLACYNGGVCSLERFRRRRDAVNPFVVGGVIGVAGALPSYATPQANAPWAYRNPRTLVGAAFSSGALCSFFWVLSRGGQPQALPEPAAPTPPELPASSQLPPLPLPSSQPLEPQQANPPPALVMNEASGGDWGRDEMPARLDGPADVAAPPPGDGPRLQAQSPSNEALNDPWASK